MHIFFKVHRITLNAETGTYSVDFATLDDRDEEENVILFNEGANNGKSSRMAQSSQIKSEEFDIVVIATPLTKDKSTIEIQGLPDKLEFPGR